MENSNNNNIWVYILYYYIDKKWSVGGYSFPIIERKLDDEGCHWFTRRIRQKTQYR